MKTTRKKVMFELVQMAGGPPDPQRASPRLQQALDQYAPLVAKRAQANPIIRANVLLPAARFGIREEMKQAYGFGWREHVRGVTTTLDIVDNLAFHEKIKSELAKLDAKEQCEASILASRSIPPRRPANGGCRTSSSSPPTPKGEIVRYFEAGEQRALFRLAVRARRRDRPLRPRRAKPATSPRPARSSPPSASPTKAAISRAHSMPMPTLPPATTKPARRARHTPGHRRAVVAFACSLNAPLIARTANLGQERVKRLIDGFGFTMPPVDAAGDRTPPSTAAVLGLIARLAAARASDGRLSCSPPSPIRATSPCARRRWCQSYDYTRPRGVRARPDAPRRPSRRTSSSARTATRMLKTLLSAPLCHRHAGQPHGTLRGLAHWCADGRADLKLHFAKTGTSTTTDPDATVDTWTTGGIQFANGAAYSYVVMVGTGTARDTWARKMHASQANVPLVEALLQDLKEHARKNPVAAAAPPARSTAGEKTAALPPLKSRAADASVDWRKDGVATH